MHCHVHTENVLRCMAFPFRVSSFFIASVEPFSDCDVTLQIIISDTIQVLTFEFSDPIELSLWECTLGCIYEQPLVWSFRQTVDLRLPY